ncbi:hypothetical protein BpHYR1_024379 [Brachionus plicatilis]|uniref:Uncharacterized protein n=1 Tax=Brachionus plicatilis TaxID=10195 RepID=A0A3M7R2K7_BRAPC|nr:hypothetical protein BpHYR1_024379 [Brachionus plicatilis]
MLLGWQLLAISSDCPEIPAGCQCSTKSEALCPRTRTAGLCFRVENFSCTKMDFPICHTRVFLCQTRFQYLSESCLFEDDFASPPAVL